MSFNPKKFLSHLLTMDKGPWLEDMRGNLSMVTSVISAITFQAMVNPLGGVVQFTPPTNNSAPISQCFNTTFENREICAGQAVLAARRPDAYYYFMTFNTISFGASLSACLLLVSGIPLRHTFPMWLLSVVLCLALTFLAAAYLSGVLLVFPDFDISSVLMIVWIGLLGFVGLFLTTRFVLWLGKQCKGGFKHEEVSTNP